MLASEKVPVKAALRKTSIAVDGTAAAARRMEDSFQPPRSF
jgi:hypothetical protein